MDLFNSDENILRGALMKKVMFLCTANSCRSQMAEGFAKEFGKGIIEVYSAGLMAAGVHRRAIAVMKELGQGLGHSHDSRCNKIFLHCSEFRGC